MHKLKLELLTVESFEAITDSATKRGTVRAHSHMCGPTVIDDTCFDTCPTQPVSCVYVCP
ncbi:MAG TPA: hypothetical protein VGC13_16835 [Longimicrobium sp.]|jgi:hypothetical protein|uniref:hypothetical protein n=1 Tax=Longimicrobium sp. TaxID=2029185 RepID=UPI002ED8BA0F